MVTEATLHHHPIHCTGKVDVCRQEDDVLTLEGRDALVDLHQMRHHLKTKKNTVLKS